jgi:hypothetical protein
MNIPGHINYEVAPELYEALRLLLNDLRPGSEVQYEHIRRGLRAIEKAEGKNDE